MSFAIITDSTSDLPDRLLNNYKISIIPVNIRFGRQVFRDREELSPSKFYSMLSYSDFLPITTPPTPVFIYNKIKEKLNESPQVLFITLSRKLSRTYHNAMIAKEFLPEKKVEVLDSSMLTIGTGLLVLYAAMLRDAGYNMSQVIRKLEKIKKKSLAMMQPENLVFLERSGRVENAIQLFVGKTFKAQPVLGLQNDEVFPLASVFSFKKGIEKMTEIARSKYGQDPVLVGVVDSGVVSWADVLESKIKEILNPVEIIRSTLGPSVGTHIGPNSIGIAIVPFEELE